MVVDKPASIPVYTVSLAVASTIHTLTKVVCSHPCGRYNCNSLQSLLERQLAQRSFAFLPNSGHTDYLVTKCCTSLFLVHRLDRLTSGLVHTRCWISHCAMIMPGVQVLFARNSEAASRVSKLMRENKVSVSLQNKKVADYQYR